MESVSSRQEGDLDDRLVQFADSKKMGVTLVLGESLNQIAVQHTAWILTNLLVRLEGYVQRVSVCCPEGIKVHPCVFPFQTITRDFREALLSAAASLEIVPVVADERIGLVFEIGPGDKVKDGWRVYGSGWVGGISKAPLVNQTPSDLPFGPYVAACFAASEVFKVARMREEYYCPSEGFYDTWSLRAAKTLESNGPPEIQATRMSCTLAGVGAVGNSFLHTMAACTKIHFSAVLADNDQKGVEISNLNRYVLFGKRHVNMLKPDAACSLLRQPHLHLTPHNGAVETVNPLAQRLLSAVDTNRAREAIQYSYPARIISASTFDLRTEVHRCGPPGQGACLRCFNPPERLPTDAELAGEIRNAANEELERLARQAGIGIQDVRNWIRTAKCGDEGVKLLEVLRNQNGGGRFAVGFTSVLAGVLLATEFIKDSMGFSTTLDSSRNHAVFQFFEVLSDANECSFVGRDPTCEACNPSRPSFPIWNRRFMGLRPPRP